jgi:hypothetical protein
LTNPLQTYRTTTWISEVNAAHHLLIMACMAHQFDGGMGAGLVGDPYGAFDEQ